MKELVIDISDTGKVSALHTDQFDLGFLGRKQIERASHIEFDEDAQSFYVVLATAVTDLHTTQPELGIEPARGFAGYEQARAFEVDWIQRSMKAGVDPLSVTGVVIANRLRKTN